jgi:uncharacterized protein (TIGR02300 family)
MRALRGTRRVCRACAARFYDLSRERIICPSCGARHVPDALPIPPEAGARRARFTNKTDWRGRSFKPADAEQGDVAPEVLAAEDTTEGLSPGANEDVVLDEEADGTDTSGLLGHHESEPKER